MLRVHIYIIVLISFFGCKNQTKTTHVFFGGEVINPKSDYVLFMQNKEIIDTLFLNSNRRFGKEFSNLKSGLYSFKHGYEFQYIYFEPHDSIQIRLNTWDFDESLVFDGKGADRNELLMSIFKGNEMDMNTYYDSFSLSEREFDSLIRFNSKRYKKLFEDFKKTNSTYSNDFEHLVHGAINYPIYHVMELYPYWHEKCLPTDSAYTPSDDFYNFRKNIDLNDRILSQYFAYQNYVSAYLYKQAKHNTKHDNDSNFKLTLLQSIVDSIKLSELRNQLLFNEVGQIFIESPSALTPELLSVFYNNSTDKKAVRRIKLLQKDKEKLLKNSTFPNFSLTSISDEIVNINSIIKERNAAIIFWSAKEFSTEYLEKRIQFLSDKYPGFRFVSINVDLEKKTPWLHNTPFQFKLHKSSTGHTYVQSKYGRVVFVDAKGIVSNGYTFLTNSSIEKEIEYLFTNKNDK